MKVKTYTFTEDEMMTLRNAMIEYLQFVKSLHPKSPIAIKNKKNAESLKNQFVQDYSLT